MNTPTYARSWSLLSVVAVGIAVAGCAQDGDELVVDEEVAAESQALHSGDNGGELVLQNTPQRKQQYKNHAKGWLAWAMEIPWSTGPVTDTTGAACAVGQDGNVWYLAGTEGGHVDRECTIPANKKLFFPLRNLWSIPPAEFVDEPSEVAEFVAFFTDYFPADRAETCALTLRVDGEDVLPTYQALDHKLWVQILNPFPIFVNPIDNWAGYAGGDMPAALLDGHYALLKPLSPGDHTIELGGAQCYEGEVYFETSATYTLHVEEEDCD